MLGFVCCRGHESGRPERSIPRWRQVLFWAAFVSKGVRPALGLGSNVARRTAASCALRRVRIVRFVP